MQQRLLPRKGLAVLSITYFRSLKRLMPFLIVLLVGIWLYKLGRDPSFMPINQIKVQGDYPHVDRARLKTLLMPLVDTGFLDVNIGAVKARLYELPWVEHANVERVWPDTVLITLNEKTAVANWQGSHLLNQEGLIFSPPLETFPKNLPLLIGPNNAAGQMLAQLRAINNLLFPLKLWVSELLLSESGSWSLVLSNGIPMRLGEDPNLKAFKQFVLSYETVIGNQASRVDYVDLRYNNAFALRWR